jgi:hypothetical protein
MIMHRAIDDLTTVLEKQIGNYDELKALILEKREAILANDVVKLSDVTSRIKRLIASNNQLEIGRMQLVKKLAAELKLTDPKPTLRTIAGRVGSPLSERLMEMRRRAAAGIKEVRRQNRINAELLKYCVDLTDSVLKRLMEPAPYEITYGNEGKTNRKMQTASLLDHHA